MQTHIEEDFRNKVKETFMEILEKDSETFYPMFQEIMEDFALSKAMEEGERAPEVQEENVFQLLK